jgi:hypothetical protein
MTTPILDLDEWESAQAQPEVTVNEGVRWLECFAALSVASMTVNDPPSAIEGNRYIVGDTPTGDWTGHARQVALVIGGAWDFRTAPEGTTAWVEDDEIEVRYLADAWTEVESGGGGGGGGSQIFSYHVSIDPASPHSPVFRVPIDANAARWFVIGQGGPGDAEIDVRWQSGGTTPPDSGDSIVGTATIEVTAANGATSTDFSDWTVNGFEAGNLIQFVLVSSATFTRVDFQLDLLPV